MMRSMDVSSLTEPQSGVIEMHAVSKKALSSICYVLVQAPCKALRKNFILKIVTPASLTTKYDATAEQNNHAFFRSVTNLRIRHFGEQAVSSDAMNIKAMLSFASSWLSFPTTDLFPLTA
jgi:hypothetical protein